MKSPSFINSDRLSAQASNMSVPSILTPEKEARRQAQLAEKEARRQARLLEIEAAREWDCEMMLGYYEYCLKNFWPIRTSDCAEVARTTEFVCRDFPSERLLRMRISQAQIRNMLYNQPLEE